MLLHPTQNYHNPLWFARAMSQRDRPKFQSSNIRHFHNFSNFEKRKEDPLLFFDEEYVCEKFFRSVAYWRRYRARRTRRTRRTWRTRRTRRTDIISEFDLMKFYVIFILIFARIRIFDFQGTAILSSLCFAIARK